MPGDKDQVDIHLNVTGGDVGRDQIDKVTEAEKQLAAETQKSGEGVRRASSSSRTYTQEVSKLGAELEQVATAEDRHRRAVENGAEETDDSRRESVQRRSEIERLTRELAEAEDHQERFNRELRESISAQRQSSSATGEAASGTSKFTSSLQAAGRAAGAVGIGLTASGGFLAILGQIRREYESIIELQDKAFRTQSNLATSERSLKLNLSGQSDEVVDEAFAIRDRVAKDYSLPLAETTDAVGATFSSTGGNLNLSEELLRGAAQIAPDRPGELADIAGSLGDIYNAIGAKNVDEAIGFLNTAGATSRVANFDRQARSIPAAVKGAIDAGFTPAGGAGLFSALSIGSADVTGDQSKTSTISFANQISEFFAERERPERGESALAALQSDEALRNEFIEGLSLEQAQLASGRELLLPGSAAAQNFQSAADRVGTPEQLAATGRRTLTQLGQGSREVVAQANRSLAALTDQLLNDNTAAAEAGAIRGPLQESLQAAGESDLSRRFGQIGFDRNTILGDGDAFGKAIRLLGERRAELDEGEDNRVRREAIDAGINQLGRLRTVTGREDRVRAGGQSQSSIDLQTLRSQRELENLSGLAPSERSRQMEARLRSQLGDEGLESALQPTGIPAPTPRDESIGPDELQRRRAQEQLRSIQGSGDIPQTSSGDPTTHQLLSQLINAVQGLDLGFQSTGDQPDALADAPRGMTINNYGDQYLERDPATAGLREAHRNG